MLIVHIILLMLLLSMYNLTPFGVSETILMAWLLSVVKCGLFYRDYGLVLGDTDDTHDVSRYQIFTILVSCMSLYFLVPRYQKHRD